MPSPAISPFQPVDIRAIIAYICVKCENQSLHGDMNRYFDFTNRQLKFLAVLSATALLMGGYLLVKTYAYQPPDSPPFEVVVGEDLQQFTGVFVLDPNTAPADSLELLPGIGKVLADRIIAYRQHRKFESEIDITEVNGIGPKLYERIKPYLKVKRY